MQLQTARSRLDQNKVEYPNADFEEFFRILLDDFW